MCELLGGETYVRNESEYLTYELRAECAVALPLPCVAASRRLACARGTFCTQLW